VQLLEFGIIVCNKIVQGLHKAQKEGTWGIVI